jgi:hypothetical protein
MIVDDPVDAAETLNTVDSGKGFLGNQVYVLTPISIIRYGKV